MDLAALSREVRVLHPQLTSLRELLSLEWQRETLSLEQICSTQMHDYMVSLMQTS